MSLISSFKYSASVQVTKAPKIKFKKINLAEWRTVGLTWKSWQRNDFSPKNFVTSVTPWRAETFLSGHDESWSISVGSRGACVTCWLADHACGKDATSPHSTAQTNQNKTCLRVHSIGGHLILKNFNETNSPVEKKNEKCELFDANLLIFLGRSSSG